jgi:hypothetical protein
MSYQPKAGSLTLFKNDRKEKDTHPDYKGDGMDLQGNPVWISAWIKEGKNGKFMSLNMQKKEPKRLSVDSGYNPQASKNLPTDTHQAQRPAQNFSDMDDDIPF